MKVWVPALFLSLCLVNAGAQASLEDYLRWSPQQTDAVGKSTYHDGKVGSRALLWLGVDTRVLKTERSQNYKLRATWFTPEVIRASARNAQLRSRLTEEETKALVSEAEGAGDTILLVEIDPNQGSGVIPTDWEAFLQPKGATNLNAAVRGSERPELRKMRALQGVMQRNYDYDRFWVVFPLVHADGQPVVTREQSEIELVVRIYNREGSVTWFVPPSIRSQIDLLTKKAIKPEVSAN
jgi:hypothetical protein